jgi:hypothetical protein
VESRLGDFTEIENRVREQVCTGSRRDIEIAEALNEPRWITDYVLERMEQEGLLRIDTCLGNWVIHPTPGLARYCSERASEP